MAKKIDQDEHEKFIRELAIRTRNWARRIGAFIDPDEPSEKNHGYFTVVEWCEEFEEPQIRWSDVKAKILALGEPLTYGVAGHYWGKPGSQGSNPSRLFVQAMSLMETATRQLISLQSTKDWEACKETLESGLNNSRHQMTIANLTDLINGAGISLEDGMSKALLMSGGE